MPVTVNRRRTFLPWILAAFLAINGGCRPVSTSVEEPWLRHIPTDPDGGIINLSGTADPSRVLFLRFGDHSFEPGSVIIERKKGKSWEKIGDRETVVIGAPVPLALFQDLQAVPWSIPPGLYREGDSCRFRVHREGGVNGEPDRDEYWDQVIVVSESALDYRNTAGLKEYTLVESGEFGAALPSHMKEIRYSQEGIHALEKSMEDPVMALLDDQEDELSWKELESLALPLDYQKILLAGLNDADPGYAYQNGQWFVVWFGADSSGISNDWQLREDHWFAPAIRVGHEIFRPAPLAAETGFYKNEKGRSLPMLQVEWSCHLPGREEIRLTQTLFSEEMNGVPQLFIRLELEDPGQEASLVLAHGKRPNAFYWGDRSQAPRTFVPYFASRPELERSGRHVMTDGTGSVVLRSSSPVRITQEGISETFLEFAHADREIMLATPQVRNKSLAGTLTTGEYCEAEQKFREKWDSVFSAGACTTLPSPEWNSSIDSWLSQIASITRISRNGKDRLSYGSYIYCNYYFGVEEGWATVAHALWGNGEEAKRQAEIILSDENLDKSNYHHQYRNGLSSWYASMVARLTGDRAWLEKISPAMISNGYWTIHARTEKEAERTPIGKGLLPSHIYGGDVPTPAYSLYSSGTCLKGLWETADVFRRSGLEELRPAADDFDREGDDFKKRIVEVVHKVLDRESDPPFLPFALEVENRAGNNEGPFERLTEDELGNYWNLFAPLFLHLELFRYGDRDLPSEWITGFAEQHGGLYGGLPRFYSGLDAVYALGMVNEYIERSKTDIGVRKKALAALETYMIHAASRNGHTIQEVSGFFPERLEWKDYKRAVREAPWNFGMYSVESYLHAHSSFTEPLGAGAGEGLWLIRKSLVDEMKDEHGIPDGGLFLLSTVPAEWLAEGKEIRLTDFPTVYGRVSLDVKSFIESKGEIQVSCTFDRQLGTDPDTGKRLEAWYELDRIFLRLVTPPDIRSAGIKITAGGPAEFYDPWTLELPVQDQGTYTISF